MKTILLPLQGDDADSIAVATALELARRFGAYLEGLFVHSPMPMTVPGAVPARFLQQFSAVIDENAERARALFTAAIKEKGIPLREIASPADGPTAWWNEFEGELDEIVAARGRLFDIIVVGRTMSDGMRDWTSVLESVLFDSGRPLLMPGDEPPEDLGHHVLVAWNGSLETARTLGLTRPLLRRAETVTVLSVEGASGGMVPGPSTEDVAAFLVRNGVPAKPLRVKADRRSAGETILEEAWRLNADLLVKGAYTQNRVRQMIFGGTTRHIMTHATLPVLIAH